MTSLTHHVIAAVASYYAMYVYWGDVYSTLGRNDRFPESARACSYYSVSTGTQIGEPSAVPFLTPRVKKCLIHSL